MHSFTCSCIHASIHPSCHSFIRSFLPSFLRLFVRSSLCSFVCSFLFLNHLRMHCMYFSRIRYNCFGSQPTNNVSMFPGSMNEERNGNDQSQRCCLLVSHSISGEIPGVCLWLFLGASPASHFNVFSQSVMCLFLESSAHPTGS